MEKEKFRYETELMIALKHVELFKSLIPDYKIGIVTEFITEHKGVKSEYSIITVGINRLDDLFQLGRSFQGHIMEGFKESSVKDTLETLKVFTTALKTFKKP